MLTAFKRKKAENSHNMRYIYTADGICFTLEKAGVIVPVSDWRGCGHVGALALLVQQEQAPETIAVSDKAVVIKEEALMRWLEGQERYIQQLLNLPLLYDGGLQIESSGTFHMQDFKVAYNWQKTNGTRYINAQEEGCFLTVAGERRLLSPHAWRLKNALKSLQTRLLEYTDTTEKMLGWHEVQQVLDALPEEARQQTLQNSVLGTLRLYYANAFRLEAIPSADGTFDISPVLMRQRFSLDSTEDTPIEHEALLTPALQEKYAAHYARANSISRCYALDTGRYVILNHDVQKVLQHVQEVRKRSSAERMEFLKNPRAALMVDLEDIIGEETLAAMLSERVTGIGYWQEKIVPYINMKGQQWLPDGKLPENAEKSIWIGDRQLIFRDEQQAREMHQACAAAQAEGKADFTYEGKQYPATSGFSEAVQCLYPARPPTITAAPEALTIPTKPIVVYSYDNFTEEGGRYEVLRTPRAAAPVSNAVPEQVKSKLKQHQGSGFEWLCCHYRAGSRGVLLADDMGLGKTLQALVFLAWLKQGMDNKQIERLPLLIVAPTGLLNNWKQEIDLHLKDGMGDCIDAYGSAISRYRDGKALDVSRLRQADLILTTYETLNKYQTSFATIHCAAVVFDEMQKVKNPASQITNAANSLYADFWLGMTGTPIENRLSDLWSISDILQPFMFGTIKDFSQKYEKPLASIPPDYSKLEELNKRIKEDTASVPAFMLRRMKDEVLVGREGLPSKYEHIEKIPMPQHQAQAYTTVIETIRKEGDRGQALMALQRIRAISLHHDYERVAHESENHENFINASARLKKCFELLETIKQKNEKVLVFVEYNDWQNFLPEMIAKRFGIPRPLNINGSINGQERQKRVRQFQDAPSGFDVMLISPKAGGVGLTLTAANHVIHLTRWWNPAVEDQATDRVYRIGQQKEVHVYYPIAVHPEVGEKSFDLLLHHLLDKKRRLSRNALMSAVDNEGDMQELFDEAIWQRHQDTIIQSELDAFTGHEFQRFITRRLQKAAVPLRLMVRSAVASHDGGADILIETYEGDILAIIQCKHSGNPNATTTGSDDIRRAFIKYGLRNSYGITITNARASAKDRQWQSENPQRHFLLEQKDALYPEKILKII